MNRWIFGALSVVAAVGLGALLFIPVPPGTTRHKRIEIPWKNGVPPEGVDLDCKIMTGRYNTDCLIELVNDELDPAETQTDSGYDEPDDAGAQALEEPVGVGWNAAYVWIRACGNPAQGIRRKVPDKQCFIKLESYKVPFQTHWPRTTIKVGWAPRDDAGAENMTCACSTGSNCKSKDPWLNVPDGGNRVQVPKNGLTLYDWKGEGCVPKPCVEVSVTTNEANNSMPEACRP